MKKQTAVWTLVLSSVMATFGLFGCGGSTGGTTGGNPPPTVNLSASPATIVAGGSATLTISSNGTSCAIGGTTVNCNGGTLAVSPTTTTTYTATASSSGGSSTASAVVTVTPAPPTATLTASATTITLGQNVTLTVTTTNATSCAGSGSLSGIEPCSGTIVVTPTATGTFTYTITATGAGGTSAPASVTVTVNPVPITVTSISVTANPTSITNAGQTTTCSATVLGTGAFSTAVTWTATNGTITTGGVLTPTAGFVGNATCIATSTQTGYTTVSGSATIAVTAAKPVITSISLPPFHCDSACPIIGGITISGSGFQAADTITSIPDANIQSVQLTNSNTLTMAIGLDSAHASSGFITFTVHSPDGTASSSSTVTFLGDQNLLALSASGELYSYDLLNSNIWKYKPDATSDGSISVGNENGVVVDDKTTDVMTTQNNASASLYIVGVESVGNGSAAIAVSAKNGLACVTQPSSNNLSCINLVTQPVANPTFTSATIGSQPWSVAMGLFGTETDAFVFSRNGTPMLEKVNVSGGVNPTASQSIPGITPESTLQGNSSTFLEGGWPVAVFDSGPASGTVAVLSTADNLLTTLNTSTMAIIKQVTLPGVPFRMVADKTNGNLVIAFADQANVRTTFSSVNPTTGVVTPLTSTAANLLAVGFAVSADGKSIYACDRTACQVLANQ